MSLTKVTYAMIQSSPTNVLDFGSLSGVDDTLTIQAAINSGAKKLWFPSGTYMVKAHTNAGGFGGLIPISNTEWVFEDGAVLKAITNSETSYSIIRMENISNVTFTNPQLQGDSTTHTGVTGEFGMGFYIRGCDNITINRGSVIDCWGDGVYLGQVASAGTNTNIAIRDFHVHSCRRQGMSVISVDGLLVENSSFKDIAGINPQSGIDFEPNNPECSLSRIKLVNVETGGNIGAGIIVDLGHFSEDPAIVNTIDIECNNHKDSGSANGLVLTKCLNPVAGQIKISSSIYRNSQLPGINIRRWSSTGARIKIDSPVIVNPNRTAQSSILNGAAISGSTLASDVTPTTGLGNIVIKNPSVYFEAGFTSPVAEKYAFQDSLVTTMNYIKLIGIANPVADVYSTTLQTLSKENCSVTDTGNLLYLGTPKAGNSSHANGITAPVGTTSTCLIALQPTSLWRPALIKARVFSCQLTSGTPATASTGGAYYEFYIRHKKTTTAVLMNQYNLGTTANIAVAISFGVNENNATLTATTGIAGSQVGWDIEVIDNAGAPITINFS